MGVYKRNKTYWIDYYYRGKRIREPIGPVYNVAERVLRKKLGEISENKYLDIRKEEKTKFAEMASIYLEVYSKPNKRSWKRDKISIKHLNEFFGHRYLYEIGPLDVERYKQERREKVTPASVNRELACLKHIFTKAVEWDKIYDNPASKVKLFKEDNRRVRYLEKNEIERLVFACPNYLKPIVMVAVLTGMRKSEILNLKWEDINFNQSIITLLNTKSGEKREVRMSEIIRTTLLMLKKHSDSLYVFCSKTGRPFNSIRKSFKTALRKAKIENFRFHDLRHTFASQLVMARTSLYLVQKLLGHKSIQMTQRYAHLSPDYEKAAMEQLSGRLVTNWSQTAVLRELDKKEKVDENK